MSQPHWKLYKSLGDMGNIFTDTTGVYPPEAELWQEYDDDGKTMFQVYRFPLEQHSLYKGMIIPHGFHKRTDLLHPIASYEEWFSDDLKSVASSAGTTVAKLAKGLCGRNIMDRFNAYYDIGGHDGFDNFDSYPLTMTEKELEKRERGPTARRLRTQRHGYTRPGSLKRRR
jgi:hypothetical protein